MWGQLMTLLRRAPALPPRCPACLDTSLPLEPLAGDRFFCVVCSKDFEARQTAPDVWSYDLQPLRRRQIVRRRRG